MPKEQEKTFDDPELNRAFMLGMATGLELCANGLRRMTEQQEEQRWKRHSAPIAAREWNPRHGKACSGGFPTRDGSSLTDGGTAPDAGIFSGDLFPPDGWKVSDRERAAIVRLCQESDGRRGIWKRIDENRELMELLADSDGNDQVGIFLKKERQQKLLGLGHTVRADEALLKKLSSRYGKENVKVVEKPIENSRRIQYN